jgi:2-amino-4-hydroxy-6-hydroxymethyldihydropteridine diphosphokinase
VGEKGLNLAFIALGANLGNREENIIKAIELINSTIGKVIKQAKNIETEPVDMYNANLFMNTCIEVQTSLNVEYLLEELKKIEINLGRSANSKGKNESRTIDLDIIFYNQIVYSSENLTIPHPNYHKRDFVLVPMLELDNQFIDPKTKITLKQLIN